MEGGPVTLDELVRVVDKMESRFNDRFRELESRNTAEFVRLGHHIDALRFVNLDQYRAERDALVHRVGELEESNKWVMRFSIGAVVMAIIIPAFMALVQGGAI